MMNHNVVLHYLLLFIISLLQTKLIPSIYTPLASWIDNSIVTLIALPKAAAAAAVDSTLQSIKSEAKNTQHKKIKI